VIKCRFKEGSIGTIEIQIVFWNLKVNVCLWFNFVDETLDKKCVLDVLETGNVEFKCVKLKSF
jgi:hypothetical protein